MIRVPGAFALAAAFLAVLCGCDNMKHQNNYRPYDPAPFFPGRTEAQPPPAGTVEAGRIPSTALETGRDGSAWLTRLPVRLTLALLERGRERFDIDCSPCHGLDGYGRGIVVQRGFPAPPSLHEPKVRALPDGQIYDVITHGYGAMYPASERVALADRWAIVAYIRALELSQDARLADVPPDRRAAFSAP